MKILVTGANGFVAKSLIIRLAEQGYTDILRFDRSCTADDLTVMATKADFVFHLAGVNRPKDEAEFAEGNADLTVSLLRALSAAGNKAPVVLSSSIQAALDNPYGKSKAAAEQAVLQYHADSGAAAYVFRLPNVFGKWCKPNYNSAVATFCYNTVNDLPITINDAKAALKLVYIDDVCESFIKLLQASQPAGFVDVAPVYQTTVGDVATLLQKFKTSRDSLVTESVGQGLTRALYSTYLSYFSPTQFAYTVPGYTDPRGTFVEMLKTPDAGQFSFFTAHPGITRGGHYHHSKNEKFLVIKGKASYRFKHIVSGEFYELTTDASEYKIVETVPGWTHDITNIGDDELIVMLWANEIYDRSKPDTIASPLV
ncbi:capsular polysaccharide biosynthesis protein CapF [Simiduia curdlanivorans]|uniref:Capsular polysaccharide biosynthesis protein CapF n=1 Tax=Simiduia curdlanivorans TaxID=1492769 RepID=A0ABV8V3C9_9GAMM|nr:capsular polysaccharide biosynthesis protein CapF [Simiduia curdlanivorans]MDN3639977.1 capsular polysaccharide biosynthesis protein CapF [Simiduia curdlanivorans]